MADSTLPTLYAQNPITPDDSTLFYAVKAGIDGGVSGLAIRTAFGGLQNISGLITAGTNISLTGSGTSGSPYQISASGSGTPAGSTTQIQYNNAGAFGASPDFSWTDSTKVLAVNGKETIVSGTLLDQQNALTITATQPTTFTSTQAGVKMSVTSAGTSAFNNLAMQIIYLPGYTGPNATYSISGSNTALGTGTTLIPAAGSSASITNGGMIGGSSGVTTGYNVGVVGWGQDGVVNSGLLGISNIAKNSGTNIGVTGTAINTGTTPVQIGGFFGLNQTTTPTVSAALIADNGAQTSAIFLARDAGATVFTIADGGAVTATGSITTTATTSSIGTSTATSTYNMGSGATLSGSTKTINIGTGGVLGSTTVINVGAAAASSTTNLNGNLILQGNASPTYAAGKLVYDTANDCLTFYNTDANVGLQIGQEQWIKVVNNTGSSIANGVPVYLTGASAGLATIGLARADVVGTAMCVGLTTETIANGATGYVTSTGLVRGMDTSAFTTGPIYLSATTAGTLTQTAPAAPNYLVSVGVVTVVNATTGVIQVTNPEPINQASGGGGTPGGSDTYVQFNDGGAFGGDADFTWNKTTNFATVAGDVESYNIDAIAQSSSANMVRQAVSGMYYSCATSGTVIGPGTAQTANTFFLVPVTFPENTTIDDIGINCTAGVASALGKVQIYSASIATGWPDVLISESVDLDLSTAGFKSVNPSYTFLAGRTYWIGSRVSSTASVSVYALANLKSLGSLGSTATGQSICLRRALGYATAAPNPFVFTGTDVFTGGTLPPVVKWRAA